MSSSTPIDATLLEPREIALPVIVKQAVALLLTWRARARSRNRLRRELSRRSDRALGDMGLSRRAIEDVVQGRFGR